MTSLLESQARVFAALGPGSTLETVARTFAEEARSLFAVTHAIVTTFDLTAPARTRVVALSSDHITHNDIARIPFGDAENRRVYAGMLDGQVQLIPDLRRAHDGIVAEACYRSGLRSLARIPIVRGDGQAIGVISLGSVRANAFSAATVARLGEFASIVGLVCDRTELLEAREERAEKVNALTHMLGTLDATAAPDQVARAFARELRTFINADMVLVNGFDFDTGRRVQVAFESDDGIPRPNPTTTLENSASYAGVLRDPSSLYTRLDPHSGPTWLADLAEQTRLGCIIAVRLDDTDGPAGLIAAGSLNPSGLGEEELQILTDIARPLAMLLERARIVDSLKQQTLRTQAIVDILDALGPRDSLEEIAMPVAASLRATYSADHVILGTVEGDQFVVAGIDSIQWPELRPGLRLPLDTLDGLRETSQRGMTVIPDLAALRGKLRSSGRAMKDAGQRCVMRAAIRSGNETLALVSISSSTPGRFSEADARQLLQIVQPLTVAVRYFQSLRQAEQRARRLEYTNRILARLSAGGTQTELAGGFLADCRALFEADFAIAVSFDDAGPVQVLGIDSGIPQVNDWRWPPDIARHDLPVGRYLPTDSAEVFHDTRLDPHPGPFHGLLNGLGLHSSIRAPLATERTAGAITIWAKGTHHFSDEDAALLSSLSHPLALALERRAAMDSLAESERKYRSLVAQAEEMIYLVDPETFTVVDANAFTARALGHSMAELIGARLTDILDASAPSIAEDVGAMLSTGELHLSDRHYRRRDGSTFEASIVASVIGLGGRDVILVLARDVSEQKALQQQVIQSQKMDSLGTMAGYVAHDFNNLLTTIMGFAGLIKRSPNLDADDRENLGLIEDASKRAAELTGRLLSFARGGLVRFGPLDIRDVIAETLALCQPTIQPGLQIRIHLPPTPVIVEGDAGQLQQAILNIVLNARDALAGAGEISVSLQQDGRQAIVGIADNGPGMPEHVRNRIFEPFFTTKPSGSGTGLGLAIAYGIVQAHHGQIIVESRMGRGTTFTIALPALASEGD